jgi:hypothetical protein
MDTREKLIELLGERFRGCDNPLYYTSDEVVERIADHLIAGGATIQQWIPVTERLPEVVSKHNTSRGDYTDSIRVLCACVKADGKKMVKEGYCRVYSDGYIRWKIPGTIHTVTHWMPLPPAPKGE